METDPSEAKIRVYFWVSRRENELLDQAAAAMRGTGRASRNGTIRWFLQTLEKILEVPAPLDRKTADVSAEIKRIWRERYQR